MWFRNRRQRVRLQGLRTDEDGSEEGEGEAGGADEQREAYSQLELVTVTSDAKRAIAGNKPAFAPEVATETVAAAATVVEVLPETRHEESRRRRPKHFSAAVGGYLEASSKQRKRTLEDSDPAAPSKNLTSVVDPKERIALQAFVQCIRTAHGSTGDDTGSDDTEATVGPRELTVHRELTAAPDPLMNACVSFVISDLRDPSARRRKQRRCDSPVSEHSSTSTIPSLSGWSTETVLSGHSGHSISRGESLSGRCSEVGLAVEAVVTAGGEAGVTPCELPATFEFPLEQYAPPCEMRMEEPLRIEPRRGEHLQGEPAARSVYVPVSTCAGHLFGPPAGGHQQGEHVQTAMLMAKLQDATRRAEEVVRALQMHSAHVHTAAHEVMAHEAMACAANAAQATFVPVGGGHPITCLNRMVSENGAVHWAPAQWPAAGSMPMPNGSMQHQQLAMSQNAHQMPSHSHQMLLSAMANTQSGFATSTGIPNLVSRLLYPPHLGAAAYTGMQFSIPCYTMPTTSSADSAHHGAGYSSMPGMTPATSAPATSQDPAFWAVLDALLN